VTPLLYRESLYNRAHTRIQEVFGGVEPLMVVVERKGESSVTGPLVLRTIEKFQRHLEGDASVGASFSLVDIITAVNSAMHELEPKWEVIPSTAREAGGLFGIFFSGASYQETERFAASDFHAAPITFFCKDHKGENIRRIIKRSREFIAAHPLDEATFRLAGGLIGVLAAANDELLRNDVLVNVLGFGTIFVVLVATYRSVIAGVYMLLPLLVANAVANAYMGARDIGINIHTLPVVTVGVGFGIDYGLYIVSRVIEEFRGEIGLEQAVHQAVTTSGKAVTFTALTMILGTLFWTFSDIRFDAEMGLLLALWMGVSFLATMTLLPALIIAFRPRFISRLAAQ
jgi:predicted RND superfamily exporter protein